MDGIRKNEYKIFVKFFECRAQSTSGKTQLKRFGVANVSGQPTLDKRPDLERHPDPSNRERHHTH
jgi:hypothetical protein